jgi:hypothetical protein
MPPSRSELGLRSKLKVVFNADQLKRLSMNWEEEKGWTLFRGYRSRWLRTTGKKRPAQIAKERMADRAANALNPDGGQKFRFAAQFCRRKSGRRTKPNWPPRGRWFVETVGLPRLLADASCKPEVDEQSGPPATLRGLCTLLPARPLLHKRKPY